MRRVGMADESPPSPPECFICVQSVPAPRKSACLCKNLHVHTACLQKLLHTRGNAQCGVCGAAYRDVACATRRRLVLCSPLNLVLFDAFAMLGLSLCSACLYHEVARLRRVPLVLWLAQLAFGAGLMAALCVLVYTCYKNDGLRGVWRSRYREEKVFRVGRAREAPAPADIELQDAAAAVA